MDWVNYSAKVIAAMNQKGGVGKSTVITVLAEYYAFLKKKRVLIIDLDMQCNSSDDWIGMEPSPNAAGGQIPPIHPDYDPSYNANERSTIADIFYGKSVLPYESWLTEEIGNGGFVDVILGHPMLLEEVNNEFSRSDDLIDEKVHNRIRNFLSLPDIQESYDIILLDTGPSRSPIFRSAMRAASHVIIPFTPEEKDIQGIAAMMQAVRQENYFRPSKEFSLEILGLLPNKVRNTRLHKNNLRSVSLDNPDLFPSECWLPLSTKFPERDDKGARPKSLFEIPKSELARQRATAFCLDIDAKLFGENTQDVQHDDPEAMTL
ncbi:MAG: ParA family protein [Gammaproteobacteria bacterium]|nr:ParA family protein [Gammaproteobacteria bacterium]